MYRNIMHRRDALIKRSPSLTRLFVGEEDEVAIVQWPNAPLLAWAFLRVLTWFTTGHIQSLLNDGAIVLLLVWGALEIGWGSSLFRKMLGSLIAAEILYNLVKLIVR